MNLKIFLEIAQFYQAPFYTPLSLICIIYNKMHDECLKLNKFAIEVFLLNTVPYIVSVTLKIFVVWCLLSSDMMLSVSTEVYSNVHIPVPD